MVRNPAAILDTCVAQQSKSLFRISHSVNAGAQFQCVRRLDQELLQLGRAFVIVWPTSRFTSLHVPDVWTAYTADHPVAAGARKRIADPTIGAIVLPFLASAGLSARSGLTFTARRRRLRS